MPAFGAGLGGTMSFVGAFRFTQQAGPLLVWSTGCVNAASFTRNGAGDYTFVLGNDYAIDDAEMWVSVAWYTAAVASKLQSWGIASASDTSKRLTTLQETGGGGASALTDIGDVGVWLYKRPTR